jgi:hypothetical protein
VEGHRGVKRLDRRIIHRQKGKTMNNDERMARIRQLAPALNELAEHIHALTKGAGWWDIPAQWEPRTDLGADAVQFHTPSKVALVHSEVSEMLEGFRKGLHDDHLPHRLAAEVEGVDVFVRMFDLCGAHGFDLNGGLVEKVEYNARRADHKREARAADGGKKF